MQSNGIIGIIMFITIKHNLERRTKMAQYECNVCGYIYIEEDGLEEQGIAPGTKWADVPDSFECPMCGVGKEEFSLK